MGSTSRGLLASDPIPTLDESVVCAVAVVTYVSPEHLVQLVESPNATALLPLAALAKTFPVAELTYGTSSCAGS